MLRKLSSIHTDNVESQPLPLINVCGQLPAVSTIICYSGGKSGRRGGENECPSSPAGNLTPNM